MVHIIQNGDPVLRTKAKEILVKDIRTPKIQKVLKEMSAALATQSDGVAIAAPQIGYALRIFVVAGKIFDPDFVRGKKANKTLKTVVPDVVFINPVITKLSKKKEWKQEGCLSVRPLWGEVERSLNATVVAYDEKGKKFERGAGGLLAHIFQHETDHLDGILFIDKAKNVKASSAGDELAE